MKTLDKLYERVASIIESQIGQGIYKPGDRLPGLRRLASHFKVSISTMLEACHLLEDQGLIEVRPRSGYFVRLRNPQVAEPWQALKLDQDPVLVTDQMLTLRLVQATNAAHMVQLGAAVPHISFLPAAAVSQALRKAARQSPHSLGQYEFPPGLPALRQQLARHMLELGYTVPAAEIVITNGVQEALVLALRAVAQPGDVVAIESPTFYGLLQAIESAGMRALEIPTHPREGLSLEALESALDQWPIKACIVVPNFNNPLGYVMSDAHKQELVALLASRGIPLIEDDVYGDLSFSLQRPSILKSWDRGGNVIYCASFSKTLSPGLRVGWMVPGRFQEKIEYLKYVLNLASATAPQLAVAQLLAQGGYRRYLRRVTREYAQAVARMLDAAALVFPQGTRLSQPAGGFVIWVELPAVIDAMQLSRQAFAEHISLAAGPLFSPSRRYQNCIRLNCALPWDEGLTAALKRIGQLAHRQLEIT